MKCHIMILMRVPNFLGTKFVGNHFSWGQKKGAKMRLSLEVEMSVVKIYRSVDLRVEGKFKSLVKMVEMSWSKSFGVEKS